MRHGGIVLLASLLAAAGAGAFALDRAAGFRSASIERDSAQKDLESALALAERHPRAFGPGAGSSGESALKGLAQQSAKNRGVTIGFLSESEREAEKGRRERQIHVRLVNAPHRGLVQFLEDLEAKGSGATVKELHLRPSPDGDVYLEAELVLSKLVSAPGEKP